MEPEDDQHHSCKRACLGNGHPATKLGHKELQHQDEDEEDGEKKIGREGWAGIRSGGNCLMPWQNHPSSRIYRVSRASGGKDRHSKVYTAKGLRDRRVRLSVSTAIQFYDLQDRLGYDQPSKAIEWLIKAATAAIDELPLLDNFLSLPSQHPIDKDKSVAANREGNQSYNDQQQQHLSTKSGCSSNSETSKGSVLSLSPSENCIKKRERANERAVNDRNEGRGPTEASNQQKNKSSNLNTHSSFTELLTAGGGGNNGSTVVSTITATGVERNPICMSKQISTANYFSQAGLFSHSQKPPQLSSSFSSPSDFGQSSTLGIMPFNITAAAVAGAGEQSEMHQFSFLQDHLIPIPAQTVTDAQTGDHNLNFSMSSGFSGFNRGTLQSNSSSELSHHNHQHHHSNHNHLQQRFSTAIDGSNLSPFFGVTTAVANVVENQFPPGYDSRLQLYYGEGFRHSDLKEKRKS